MEISKPAQGLYIQFPAPGNDNVEINLKHNSDFFYSDVLFYEAKFTDSIFITAKSKGQLKVPKIANCNERQLIAVSLFSCFYCLFSLYVALLITNKNICIFIKRS